MAAQNFYRLGVSTALISSTSLLILLLTLPVLLIRINNGKRTIEAMASEFDERTKILWKGMLEISTEPSVNYFSRSRRSPWDRSVCRGCFQLACPGGPTGPPGDPGMDGLPGEPGVQGPAGDDGYDVQLEPEQELPCVICPAGPPGHQGERGRPGDPGSKGRRGPNGAPGKHGPVGNPGAPGLVGQRGEMGKVGPPGDTTIAGVGIKGPKGPAGPAGPKGPMGASGKASNVPGMPGKTGKAGDAGPVGRSGRIGEDGPWGPPGEPGEPAAYCPSDCGVSEILAPSYIRPEQLDSFGSFDNGFMLSEAVNSMHRDSSSSHRTGSESAGEQWSRRLWFE